MNINLPKDFKRAIVDRFEDDYVVCEMEDGKMESILRSKFPDNIKESDSVVIYPDNIIIDETETLLRHKKVKNLLEGFWKN